MEINDGRNTKQMYFGNLFPGDVFEYDDDFFMKINAIGSEEEGLYNAVGITDGCPAVFEGEDCVIPLVVQLNIIRNG